MGVDGSKDGHLATTVDLQLTKVLFPTTVNFICCDIICDHLYNFMFVSDLTNHSVRSGVDLLLSLLTIPQKLHSRQYGIHSKRMNTPQENTSVIIHDYRPNNPEI